MQAQRFHMIIISFLCCALLLLTPTALLQEATVVVPNLVGQTAPQAAATLNRVGLVLGAQNNTGWTAESGLPQNTIGSQSVPADQAVAPGTPIDVNVLRSPNVAFIYDENDFTLINNTGAPLDMNGLVFGVADGTMPAAFAGTRWTGALQPGSCAQVWSVQRSIPKDTEGCARINFWLTTNNTAEHFWTALNGVNSFNVVQGGVSRGVCPAAPAGTQPMRCDLYFTTPGAEETTPYIYFAYTPERLIIFNRSTDKWMPLANATVLNNNSNLTIAGLQVNLSDPTLVRQLNPVANITQLAPSQCLLFTNNTALEAPNPPEPCDVIGQADIAPELIFWSANFDVVSQTDGLTRTCAAATPGRLTICVMPR
jgi:hypothetical protein